MEGAEDVQGGIACSDVAACPGPLIFGYGIARPATCRSTRSRSSLASISSWTSEVAVMKPTTSPLWQVASPRGIATRILPVPLFPIARLEMQTPTEQYRQTYNRIRSHSSLGCGPPAPEAVLSVDLVPALVGQRRKWYKLSDRSNYVGRYFGEMHQTRVELGFSARFKWVKLGTSFRIERIALYLRARVNR